MQSACARSKKALIRVALRWLPWGAGLLHGAEVAAILAIPEVIVPPWPGIASAVGLLVTDLKQDAVRTLFQTSGHFGLGRISADLARMQEELSARFCAGQRPQADASYACIADLRHVGQGYELSVPIPDGPPETGALDKVLEAFHTAHAAEYGHACPGNPVEMVNLRVTGRGAIPQLAPGIAASEGLLTQALIRHTDAVFRAAGKLRPFSRPSLTAHPCRLNRPLQAPRSFFKRKPPKSSPPVGRLKSIPRGRLSCHWKC